MMLLNLEWKDAKESEFRALKKNQKWTMVFGSNEDNFINTKWVFKVKQREGGTVECYKARRVDNATKQIKQSDYTQTFNLMVKANSICLVLLACGNLQRMAIN